MGSKNIGQVAGMHIGTTPPENIKMIWWDSTPSQACHKIYDSKLKQWVILNQGILSTITYNELKNLALSVGLSVGKFYVVTDKGNILALSITRTKVQYVDLSGNLLVDDLGSNITYYVSSNNLTIDGENGVFDDDSIKLNFDFIEAIPDIESAYIFGKDKTEKDSSVMRLIKFKLSSLISTFTGNALSWKSGLYFNFNETLLELGDKKGGVVLFNTYSKDKEIQDQSIENIANNYNSLVSQVNSLIKEATTDANIWDKRLTKNLQTDGEPIDANTGDSIYTVLSKFQRYINKFKFATGIKISKNFTTDKVTGEVNSNDTVESAVAKLVVAARKANESSGMITDFDPERGGEIQIGDTTDRAVSKLQYQINENLDKINETRSILPSDILKFKITSEFDFNGGFGFITLRSSDSTIISDGFLKQLAEGFDLYNLRIVSHSKMPDVNVLSFAPVIPIIKNTDKIYSIAAPFPHYIKENIVIQFLIQLEESVYNSLYSSGKRNLRLKGTADVYGYVTPEINSFVTMSPVSIFKISVSKETLNKGGGVDDWVTQHIVFNFNLSVE